MPSTRPASTLEPLIRLAADLGTELVVLCSRLSGVEQVAERIERRMGASGVVACLGDPTALDLPTFLTSHPRFDGCNGGRHSDLSAKRNLGLRLAQIRGWSKIVFIDDDMTVETDEIVRLVRLLDRFPIAGMRSLKYPDNSAVCHARRLAGEWQDVFTSGSVLGVNCESRNLDFFPNVYNEDWFFFGEAVTAHGLPRPRTARQQPYNPFRTRRAQHEEFGDLLAEGLYALIDIDPDGGFESVVERAGPEYWDGFIEARLRLIDNVTHRLERHLGTPTCGDDVVAALSCLAASRAMHTTSAIDPVACVDFLQAWRKDSASWRNGVPVWSPSADTASALRELGVQEPLTVRPGQRARFSCSLVS